MDPPQEDIAMGGNPPQAAASEENVSQSIMNGILKEQAYQELNTKLAELQQKLTLEQAEKAEFEKKYQEEKTRVQQLQHSSLTQASSFSSNTQLIDDLNLKIEILRGEKKEITDDVEKYKKKSRSDNEEISRLRDRFILDSSRIRQLETDRLDAIGEKNSFEHNFKLIQDSLKAAQTESQTYAKSLIDKSGEFAAYRTQAQAEVENLQATVSAQAAELSSLNRAKSHLEGLYQRQSQTLYEANAKIQELSDKIGSLQSSFRTVDDRQKEAIRNLEADLKAAQAYMSSVQERVDQMEARKSKEVAEAEEKVKAAQEAQLAAQAKMKELSDIVEGAQQRSDIAFEGSLSSTAAIAVELESQGKSFVDLYTEHVKAQNQLAKQKTETVRLKQLLDSLFKDISEKAPILQEQRREYEALKTEANGLATSLSAAIQARDEAQQSLGALRIAHEGATADSKKQQSQIADFGIQVRTLLRELAVRDDPQLAFEPFDPRGAAIVTDGNDIDTVISSNLVAFRNLPGLLEQNQRLLKISRALGKQLEAKEQEIQAVTNGTVMDDSEQLMSDAQSVVSGLQSEVVRVKGLLAEAKIQTEQYMKERDIFSQLLVQSKVMGVSSANGVNGSAGLAGMDSQLDAMMRSLQSEFEKHRTQLNKDKLAIQEQLDARSAELQAVKQDLSKANNLATMQASQNQIFLERESLAAQNLQTTQEKALTAISALQATREEKQRVAEERDAAKKSDESHIAEVNHLKAEKSTFEKLADEARKAASDARAKQAELAREIETRNLLTNSGREAATQRQAALEKTIEDLREEIKGLRTKLLEAETLPQDTILQLNAQIRSNTSTIAELEKTIADNETKYTEDLEEQKKLVEKWQQAERNKNNIGLRFRSQFQASEARVKTLEEESVTLNEKVKLAEEAVATKQAAVDALQSRVDANEKSLETANAQVLSLQTQVLAGGQSTPDIASTQRIATLEAQIASLTAAAAAAASTATAQPMEIDSVTPSQDLAELRSQLESKVAEQQSLLELLKPLQSSAQAASEANALKPEDPQSWGDFLRTLATDLVALRAKSDRYTEVVRKANESNKTSTAAKNNALKQVAELTEEVVKLKAAAESQRQAPATPTPAPEAIPVAAKEEESAVKSVGAEIKTEGDTKPNQELEALQAINSRLKSELEKAKADLAVATAELEKLKGEVKAKDELVVDLTAKAEKAKTAEATMASAQELEARSRAKTQQLENKLKKAQAQLAAFEKNEKERKASVSAAPAPGAALSIKGSSATPAASSTSTTTGATPIAAGTRAGAIALRGLGSTAPAAAPITPVVTKAGAVAGRGGATVRGGGRGRGRGGRPQIGSNMDLLAQLDSTTPSASTPTTGVKRNAPADDSPTTKPGEDASKRQKVNSDSTTQNGPGKPEGS